MVVMLFLALASCKKSNVVELDPIDRIPSEKAFITFNDVTTALNGVYGTWQARRSVYTSAQLTDELRLGSGTAYRNVGNILFNYQFTSDTQDFRDTEQSGIWTNLYSVIDRANRLLEFMVPVPTINATEAAQKIQYRGELLALRAMAHLELLRWYSETAEYTPAKLGIIIQKEYAKAVASHFPSRSPQSEVIEFINADLAEARTLIPTTFTDISRVTRNAVIATQARSALHTKNWQGVIDRASEVITSQPLTPRASYAALWTTQVLPANQSTEVIWKLNVSNANAGSAIGSLFQDGNGAVQASASIKLVNSYDKVNDVRFPAFFLANNNAQAVSNPWLILKYGAVINNNGENFLYDIKMIRTSELVLARAEANAELGKMDQANIDLAALRTQRIANYTHVPITDKATFINEVYLERFRELAYEGQRYHDLRRRSLPVNRDASDVTISTSQTLLPTDTKYILPIPQQEFFANPNVGQNPGY